MVALGIGLAAPAGFVLGGIYYAVTPAAPAVPGHAAPSRPAPAQVFVELVRSAALAGVIAVLMIAAGFHGPVAVRSWARNSGCSRSCSSPALCSTRAQPCARCYCTPVTG